MITVTLRQLRYEAFARALSRLACVVSGVILVACGSGNGRGDDTMRARSPGDEAREIAVAIDRSVPKLTRTEWSSSKSDTSAKLSAFRDAQALRLIRERLEQKERGVMANRYYFANGHLRYFESEGDLATAGTPSSKLVRQKQHLVLAFDLTGTVVEGSRQLDGETAAMDSAQIKAILARAQELLREEAKAPTSTKTNSRQ